MIGAEGFRTEDLGLCFEELMVFTGSGGDIGVDKMLGGGAIAEWKDIPMELLLRIVSLVDDQTVIVAAGVCSGWRDAICWGLTHLSLSWCKNNMNNLVLSLAPKFTKLETLVLRQDKPQLKDDAVETIANYCHDLQDLDLSKSFKLTDRSLFALARGCPNLIKLNISGCSSFSDTSISYLAGFCRKLKYLNLCGCSTAASDKALKVIGYNCSQLQSLTLGWCEYVSDAGVMSLAYGCPDLRALDLCGCVLITVIDRFRLINSDSDSDFVTLIDYKSTGESWHPLCRHKDESVIALANNCPHLRSLGLYYCRNITDRAMYSLAQSRVRNKHPEMWESVENRYQEKEGLMNLNISQCTALTPPAVQAVCDSFPALHTCPGRHSLIISGCLNLTSVHCACSVQGHRGAGMLPHPAV